MYNHSKVLSGSTAYTLLPMGLKFQPGDNTGNKSYLQHSSKHHEKLIEIFSARHWLALPFPDYFLFQKKSFQRPYSQLTSTLKRKVVAGKLWHPDELKTLRR